jgi:hypothetical protein
MVKERMARFRRALMTDRETGWRFAAVVGTLYLIFLIWMQLHHEMWRDEVHAWSLAQIAESFGDLVNGDRRYEGHPPLWFWYLRVWGWLFPQAWGLQVATVVPAVGGALLMLRCAPFPRYLKVMLLATYFFGYEYTVMCRNYVLGWFLLCVFCTVYHPLRPRPLTLAVVLALLSLTSVYGLLIAIVLTGFLALETVAWRGEPEPRKLVVAVGPRRALAALVVLAACAFSASSIEPFDPNPYVQGWHFSELTNPWALVFALTRVIDGLAPVRPFVVDFWGRGVETWALNLAATPYCGAILLLAAVSVLFRSWRVTLFYVGAVLLMELSQIARYWGNPRHWGHYFMALVVACWLLRTLVPRRLHKPSLVLLTVLCCFQFEGFLVATIMDTREVFSGGRDAAAFIRRAGLQDLPLVAGPAIFQTPASFLRRPFYCVENEEVEETIAFHGRRGPFSTSALLAKAIAVSREHHGPVVVITWMDVLPPPPPEVRSQLLTTTRPGIVDEQFRVYLLDAS